MKKLMTIAALAATATACRVVEVENHGEGILVDTNGAPVLVKGGIVKYTKGWKVYHNQHWMATSADSLEASVKAGEISFALNKLNAQPSEELAHLVDVSFQGAAQLAAKIGAAIATAGGSTASDAAKSAIKKAINSFISKGGDANKATVSCEGGACTISDGTVTETCTDCGLPGWVEPDPVP